MARLGMPTVASVLVLMVSVASASDDRLIDAVRHKDIKTVQALLKQGADVNRPQGDGATALHWAAYWDDVPTGDALLRAGANVNSANQLGVTPLMIACENRNP